MRQKTPHWMCCLWVYLYNRHPITGNRNYKSAYVYNKGKYTTQSLITMFEKKGWKHLYTENRNGYDGWDVFVISNENK